MFKEQNLESAERRKKHAERVIYIYRIGKVICMSIRALI